MCLAKAITALLRSVWLPSPSPVVHGKGNEPIKCSLPEDTLKITGGVPSGSFDFWLWFWLVFLGGSLGFFGSDLL